MMPPSTAVFSVGPALNCPHTHTIILLHGRNNIASEFATEFLETEATGIDEDCALRALFPTIRWVFPQATTLRSSRLGIHISQWFDMWSHYDVEERSELQTEGLRESIDRILETIRQEEQAVPRERIFLGGFSQGFATYIPCPLFPSKMPHS